MATKPYAGIVLLVLLAGCTGGPTSLDDLEPHLRDAVLRGERLMDDPSLGTKGLSCASCHPNPEMNRGWASEFPRRWSTPRNPEPRVVTLAQHNAGALMEMMGGEALSPDDPRMVDLEAYIAWLGRGTPIWSEETPGRKQLEEKVLEGEVAFLQGCASCHREDEMRGIAARFPRYVDGSGRVLNLEGFLGYHAGIFPGNENSTALVTYLMSLSKGYLIDLR